ncbi:type 2 isopentenyl-diphosphate Delta-isomerase [Microbacterium sp. cx-59]|uniref:type 2 isopentenyl-diphosphate Delta-isomerase n=1 Tax=Microbacterium sp. cx-59 TaxID=2891207 RepID=UPI001E5D4712|nr:type 2 isopentenyl-diphosphate Delta-isomerase [Microbacterium sp. cx-59]MCC4907364.1 type 2 isopentenyl-diphosphate Delta-isomerase [Microbacterium sp. cx-59]
MSAPGPAGRKDDHVRLAADQQAEGLRGNDFDDITFLHHALDGIDADTVDTSVEVAGTTWSLPFHINAMTGGSAATGRINRDLAIAARETGVAIASGSLSAGLDDPALLTTFRVLRDENPDGVVWANIGVERRPDDARRAVDALAADALQVHLNSIQETVMPEGSRHFSGWLRSLEALRDAVEVPIVVKEVGFGLSTRTLSRLTDLGIRYADVSGRGGTDFVRIENSRRAGADYEYLTGWGQSAVASLLDAPASAPVLLASGGVRSPLDVVRALALGARAVGVSGTFLAPVLDGGADALIARITQWTAHTRALLAVLGAATPADLVHSDLIIDGSVARFCAARGIDITAWAHRSDAAPSTERSRHDR